MRHEVPIGIPDPFLYLERDGERHVVLTSFEIDRVNAIPGGPTPHPYEEFGMDELLAQGLTREEVYIRVAIAACKHFGVSEASVPATFPAIFADRLNHACLNDGALLSRAELVRYPHRDVQALSRRLAASTAKRKLIATDAVFSMDGDLAPLAELCALAERHDAWLVVDDAHGFGVLGTGDDSGRGTLAHVGLESERVVYMGTLGKAAGVSGAFVAAHPLVIDTLLQTARSYIFTTALPPFIAAALEKSVAIIRDDGARRAHLFALVARFRERMRALPWALRESFTPIQPIVVGANSAVVELASELWCRGFWVPAIRPPTVPKGTARLRVSLSAAHRIADVDALVETLTELAPAFAHRARNASEARTGGGDSVR